MSLSNSDCFGLKFQLLSQCLWCLSGFFPTKGHNLTLGGQVIFVVISSVHHSSNVLQIIRVWPLGLSVSTRQLLHVKTRVQRALVLNNNVWLLLHYRSGRYLYNMVVCQCARRLRRVPCVQSTLFDGQHSLNECVSETMFVPSALKVERNCKSCHLRAVIQLQRHPSVTNQSREIKVVLVVSRFSLSNTLLVQFL